MNLTYVDGCGGTSLTLFGALMFVIGTSVGSVPLFFILDWLSRR